MRRSSRLETATAEKRKTKMSTRLTEHAKRQRRAMAQANGTDDLEEGEQVEEANDSDFSASSDEDEEEEEEEEEEEDEAPRRPNRKRKASARLTKESTDSDNSVESVSKIKSILKKQTITTPSEPAKPKSILKRPKNQSADSSPDGKSSQLKPSSAEPSDTHRRPVKQRVQTDSANANANGGSERTGFLGSGRATSSGPVGNTLTQFFTEILEWDLHDDLMRQAQKDVAVVTAANDGSEEGEVEVARVPSKFDSYEHYFSVWKPLALEEVQAQTLNAVLTDQPSAIPVEAAGLGSNFLDRTAKIRIDTKKTGVPMTQRSVNKKMESIFVNDLVLLTPNPSYFRKAIQMHSNGRKADSAETENEDEKQGFLGIVATQRGSREGVTLTVLSSEWRHYESRKDELFAYKLNNLVTSVREFRALCDCVNYRLLPLLLSGEHRAGSMQLDSLGLGYVRWLRGAFNESQLEAITAAATSEGFTLIKGPPGTGKTTTLKGLLNSLHLREYNRYYNAVLDVARRPDHETNQAWAKIGNEKPHILVTAPSNAAVDNIVEKIITEGFCDGEGRKYFPKIVRVGRGMSTNVRVVGLDEMVDQICGQTYDVLQHKLLSLRRDIMQVEHDSIHLRNRFRDVVTAIDRDPVGILAHETQQMQLQQQRQQEQQQQQQQTQPESPTSPPPPPPADSPPPPGMQMSPSAPSPPPSFSIGSPPANLSLYPSSPPPPAYAQSPSSPPAPSSPIMYGSNTAVSYSFGDDQDEAEEEDEAFPITYGPPATSPLSGEDAASSYNPASTSKAYNAFFDEGDDEMNAEEDEPLPNATTIQDGPMKPIDDGTSSDHDEEDEAFPPLPAEQPVATATHQCEKDPARSEGDDLVVGKEVSKTENETTKSEDIATTPENEIVEPDNEATELKLKQEDAVVQSDELPALNRTHEHTVKTEPLKVEVDERRPDFDQPMSPPPPPPMSPPPPPPMSPPPPPPPGSPNMNGDELKDKSSLAADALKPAAVEGPIVYERYYQYRVVAQQLNSCLERLSELRLEENRYNLAMRVVSENGRPNAHLRQSLEVSFLDTAHIVFTTLSSAGVTALDVSTKYDVLVVDEAAQAVELSSIIPMKFGSRQCVLVGDPQQLSATVFSRTSGVSLYERSLFERLETTDHPVHMLRTQYRSHPLISDFPRHYFYGGKLQDAEAVKTPAYDRPYHRLGAGAFTPLVFWNLLNSRETTKSVSRMNIGEVEMAVNLYLTLKNSCPPDAVAGKVGVITPYSQQVDELKVRFRRALGERYDVEVEINTVDGFQGREKDVIILSTVRADPRAGVGFLNDTRRMNVALTRAKYACYVIGSEVTLRSSKPWAALMDHAYQHNCIVHVQDPKCNLLTLRPMEMPQGAMVAQGGGRRGGGKKGFQNTPPPNVQIPPQPGHPGHNQPFVNDGGPIPGRRPSPTGPPPHYAQDRRGQSPTNQGWRGGRGRGGGRDGRRDPRLNGRAGRGGRGRAFNGGRAFDADGPPRPMAPAQFNQPPPHQHGPPNGNFGHPPLAQYASPPPLGLNGPPHAQYGGPQVHQQGYPAPQPGFQPPPVPQNYQQHPYAPPQQAPFRGPPPGAGFSGPPPQQVIPPPQFQEGGRGSQSGRVRDPRLLRQQGRGGGRSFGQ